MNQGQLAWNCCCFPCFMDQEWIHPYPKLLPPFITYHFFVSAVFDSIFFSHGNPNYPHNLTRNTKITSYFFVRPHYFWCVQMAHDRVFMLALTLLLICPSFSRENSHPLLICSSLRISAVRKKNGKKLSLPWTAMVRVRRLMPKQGMVQPLQSSQVPKTWKPTRCSGDLLTNMGLGEIKKKQATHGMKEWNLEHKMI